MAKNKKLKILFLDILTNDRKRQREINKKVYGGSTYSEAMRKAFGLPKSSWVTIDASRSKFSKDFSRYNAVVMGGSTEDPVRGKEKKWVKSVYPVLRKIYKEGIPFLGICGGLQFMVRALGGEVIFNPKGREFGNTKITLTTAGKNDYLFRGLPRQLMVQSSHKCMASNVEKGWKILAGSNKCVVQAIAIGDMVRLTQFHPEMKVSHMKALARMRKETFINEGFTRGERDFQWLMRSIKSTQEVGKKILSNFLYGISTKRK